MNLKFELGIDDLVAFNVDSVQRNFRAEQSRIRTQVGIWCGAIFFIASVLSITGRSWWPLAAGIVFSGSWLFFFSHASRRQNQVKRFRQYFESGAEESQLGVYELTIQQGSLKVAGPRAISEYPWPSISRVRESERHYYLDLDRAIALIIPKETIMEGELLPFIDSLRGRIQVNTQAPDSLPETGKDSKNSTASTRENHALAHAPGGEPVPPTPIHQTIFYWVLALLAALMLVMAVVIISQLMTLNNAISQLVSHAERVPDILDDDLDNQIDMGFEDPVFNVEDPLLQRRIIMLGHTINSRAAKDVCGRLFYLNEIDREKPIDLYISSQGGWGDNAFAIIQVMRQNRAPVNTHAMGGCYSSGVLILAAGTGKRFATQDTLLMVHANSSDSDKPFSLGRLVRQRYENLFKQTAQLPASWFPLTSEKRYYLNAQEALRYGLIDEVVPIWQAKTESAPVENRPDGE